MQMIQNVLLALAFIAAVADWAVVARGRQVAEYIAKPATMIFLFAWLCFSTGLGGFTLWFGLGVLFSLIGDVFLMLPDGNKWFIPGLVAFLLAHVAYIVGFNIPLPEFGSFTLVPAALIAVPAMWLYRRIARGLVEKGQDRLRIPVLIYTVVISIMLLSAVTTLFRRDWITLPAVLVSLGAALFFVSDAILAWNRFVTPIKNGRLMNLSTYHIGQMALIVGAAIQFMAVVR
jgi:uncharacterized membrane protein YhhN